MSNASQIDIRKQDKRRWNIVIEGRRMLQAVVKSYQIRHFSRLIGSLAPSSKCETSSLSHTKLKTRVYNATELKIVFTQGKTWRRLSSMNKTKWNRRVVKRRRPNTLHESVFVTRYLIKEKNIQSIWDVELCIHTNSTENTFRVQQESDLNV